LDRRVFILTQLVGVFLPDFLQHVRFQWLPVISFIRLLAVGELLPDLR